MFERLNILLLISAEKFNLKYWPNRLSHKEKRNKLVMINYVGSQ